MLWEVFLKHPSRVFIEIVPPLSSEILDGHMEMYHLWPGQKTSARGGLSGSDPLANLENGALHAGRAIHRCGHPFRH